MRANGKHARSAALALALSGLIAALAPPAALPSYAQAAVQPAAGAPDIKRLWAAQPALVDRELATLTARRAGRTNVYAIAVAADGRQAIFAREARLALKIAGARFGRAFRGGALLSNDSADLFARPIAGNDTLARAAKGLAARMDPARDIAFVYLTSHGSPEAWLATELPGDLAMPPIAAATLASTLDDAGIKRRVIVVSACFSGSWIPALANDDTIVIAAAARDRSSFGCADRRRLTFFGQAFLEGPLARGGSLQAGFEAARKSVAVWEKQQGLRPSSPQVHVGANMRAFWSEANFDAESRSD